MKLARRIFCFVLPCCLVFFTTFSVGGRAADESTLPDGIEPWAKAVYTFDTFSGKGGVASPSGILSYEYYTTTALIGTGRRGVGSTAAVVTFDASYLETGRKYQIYFPEKSETFGYPYLAPDMYYADAGSVTAAASVCITNNNQDFSIVLYNKTSTFTASNINPLPMGVSVVNTGVLPDSDDNNLVLKFALATNYVTSGTVYGGGMTLSFTNVVIYDISEDLENEYKEGAWQDEQRSWWQKIIDAVTGIPSLIIDGIKSLFIPDDEFIDSWFEDLKSKFTNSFGFLSQSFTIVGDIFTSISNINPKENYALTLPKLDLGFMGREDLVLWNEQVFDFNDIFATGILGTLHSVYLAFIDVVLIIAVVNLGIKKFEELTGGGN